MKLFQILVVVGLTMLLIAFGWQFLIVDYNEKIISSNQFDHISQRLDGIHNRQYQLQKNMNILAEQISSSNEQVGASYVNEHKYHTSYEASEGILAKKNSGYNNFRVILYVLGSSLIIFGKFFEYSSVNRMQ